MSLRKFLAFALSATVVATLVPPVMADQQRAIDSVQSATQVFASQEANPDRQIPRAVLQNAVAIAIIPNVIKAGFLVGGTRGSGVLSVRNSKGTWTNPAFVTLTGGSVGLQVGAQSSDVIMVFNNREALDKALAQDFRLGGSVSGSAGLVGATPVTSTSTVPDVYTYVRTRQGLFGGVSLQGTKLEIDESRNAEFYNQPAITAQQIFSSPLKAPQAAATLRQTLNRYASSK